MSQPIGTTIIGGYLGCGKTTLVNHLLRNANGARLAVLVNEFGALPIDADLIEAQDDAMISIAGGCICCSYGSDLTLALMDLQKMQPRPDHLLIESSGVALPAAIASTLTVIDGYATDGIVTLIDAETVRKSAADRFIGDTIQRQMEEADVIVLNKCDLVPESQITKITDWVAGTAPRAALVSTQHAQIGLDVIAGLWPDAPAPARPTAQPHDNPFQRHTVAVSSACDAARLARWLAEDCTGVVRAKGFVDDHRLGRVAIQIVGHRWTVTPTEKHPPCGLVLIGPKERFSPDLPLIDKEIAAFF